MEKTIESKVANTLLQSPTIERIGGKTYQVAPPSVATLILISEAISFMPAIKLNSENVINEVLSIAKDCRPLGEIIAIMILGAKGVTETKRVMCPVEKRFLFGLIKYKREKEQEVIIDRKTELAKTLMEDLSPSELHNLAARLLSRLELSDFFGLTTFLTEINLLRPTKVVMNETTAFGQ